MTGFLFGSGHRAAYQHRKRALGPRKTHPLLTLEDALAFDYPFAHHVFEQPVHEHRMELEQERPIESATGRRMSEQVFKRRLMVLRRELLGKRFARQSAVFEKHDRRFGLRERAALDFA